MRARLIQLFLMGISLVWAATATAKSFQLHGVTVELAEVTAEVDVYYRSMRFNRAAGTWNVEVLLSNKSSQVFSGPLVYYVEGFSNTSGPLQPDGLDGAKAFYDLSATVADGALSPGELSLPFTLSLGVTSGSPSVTNRIFARGPPAAAAALAFTRTLDEAGLPLPSATVFAGTPPQAIGQTDEAFGLVTLAQTNAAQTFRFSAPGYQPVWRVANATTNGIGVIPYPRLTRSATNTATFTPIAGGRVAGGTPPVEIDFPPGAFTQNTSARLIPLTGQTLPLFLPQGWSPLGAFWLQLSLEPAVPGAAAVAPWGPMAMGESAAFVRLNTNSLTWEVLQIVPGNTTNVVNVAVPGSGAFALVVPDPSPIAPPPAVVGNPLLSSALQPPNPASLRAGGTVTPASSPASRIPELVTATAEVLVTNLAGSLPSGTLLRGEVAERYRLRDGSGRSPALFDNFVVGYQRPGDTRTDTVRADFPIRPLLLFGSEELQEAVVHMDLYPPGAFSGAVLDTNGGQVASDGLRVLAGGGDLLANQAVQLRRLNVTNFTELASSNAVLVAAFELGVNGVAAGRKLVVQLAGLATNANFVLARVLARDGLYGLEPRERLRSDGSGNLASAEPASSEKLPGLNGAGQYVLLRINPAQGLVSGIAKNSSGQATSGLPVRVAGQPWLTFSGGDGSFKLLAPTGDATLTVNDLSSGDSGSQIVNVQNPQTPVNTQVSSVASGPHVVSISPTNSATSVSRVTSVVLEFDKSLNPATLVGDGIALLDATNAPVSASVTLNLRGNVVTLLPANPLEATTLHTIALSTNLADLAGRKLEGMNHFSFTTEGDTLNRPGAQLVIYEPTNDVAPVFGTPGSADPQSPVIIVNETSGQTATVLSKSDGSFTNFIAASEDDLISAVLINRNGTRTMLPASRQVFRDGSVGLFSGGGVIEVQSEEGPVQVTVQPGAIQTRTKFKLELVGTNQLAGYMNNVQPTNAMIVGNSLRLRVEGDRLNPETGGLDVSFPLTEQRLRALGFPPGADPREATYLMTVPTKVDGEFTYCVVDSMEYEDGKLATHSYPFPGSDLFISPPKPNPQTGALEVNPTDFEKVMQNIQLVGLLIDPLGSAAGELLLAPVVMAEHAFPVKLVGKTIQMNVDGAGNPVSARALAGSFVTARTLEGPSLSGARPSRLDPGSMYCLSRQNGFFALAMPRPQVVLGQPVTTYVLTATHPRFPGLRVVETATPAQATISGTDLVFAVGTNLTADPRPPALSVSHDPEFPIPTNTANLRALATHSSGPPTVQAVLDSITSLVPGVGVGASNVTIGAAVTQPAGGHGVRAVFPVTCDKAARVLVKVTASAGGGQQEEVKHEIAFGGVEPPSTNPPPSDINDLERPRVVSSVPQEGARAVAVGDIIRLRFSEAIKNAGLNSAITLSPAAGEAQLELTPDQQEVTLLYPDLQPGTTYALEVSSSVRDLAGNSLDQFPSTSNSDSFVLNFRAGPALPVPLPGMQSGGGALVRGIYAYALERAGHGAVVVYDLSDPAVPAKVTEVSVPGFPRDLTLIPNYAYKQTLTGPARTNDLLAVVGGTLGGSPDESGNLLGGFQYLWIFDISDPTHPTRISSAAVVLSAETAVSKVKWSPPLLTYLQASGDLTLVGLVNLQMFILSGNMAREEFSQVPAGTPGDDKNHDGDYVDPGDELPIPPRSPALFGGQVGAYLVDDTTQRILDFDWDSPSATLGVVVGAGKKLGIDGLPLNVAVAPAYRTLASGDLELPRIQASLEFPDRIAKRVKLLPGVPLTISNQLQVVDLAVVSLEPSPGKPAQLAVIDITDPLAPQPLQTIDIPPAHGGTQSLVERDDGMLLLATTKDVLILDPLRLNETGPTNATHPAIVGSIPEMGSGAKTFGSTLAGLNTVSLGGKNLFAQTVPRLTIMQMRDGTLFKPADIVDQPLAIESNLTLLAEAPLLLPARFRTVPGEVDSTLTPPAREVHYYVRVDAPGSAGGAAGTIELSIESLNAAGYPLRNRGSGFPPVHAATPYALGQMKQTPRSCDATIRPLTAYRLSSHKGDPNYNVYISRPFALTYEAFSEQELQTLRGNFDREVLWSGAFIRVSLDPDLENNNNPLMTFASHVDPAELIIRPGASTVAEALEADYIMGPNPPPVNGHADAPGTSGTVAIHNGEFRMDTVDFALPGRRMPITFERHYGGQDLYCGPFGRGWDFNFNQRLEELRGGVFAPGMKMPLIIRGNGKDEIGKTKDILFHTGDGRVAVFTLATNSPPSEYSQDELVKDLQWDSKGVAFYFPPEGLFDLLVRFGDGKYGRLTPEGTRFWYSRDGKLEKIQDRYTANVLEMEYNKRGDLRRIIDRTAPDRYLEIGYYRAPGDLDPGTPDEAAPGNNPSIIGYICALRDHLGSAPQRDVLFKYDDCGRLSEKHGIDVKSGNPGAFTGREVTTYHHTSDPRFDSANGAIGVSEGSTTGAPLFSATGMDGNGNVPEITAGNGANGAHQINVQHNNTAQAVASGGAKTSVTAPDGSTAEYNLEPDARPGSIKLQGGGASPAEMKFEYEKGSVKKVTYPEGNSVTYTYDTQNARLRSRGNVLSIKREPGTAGGPAIPAASYAGYNPRYNFPVGSFKDFNGNSIDYQPTTDGLDVGKMVYPGPNGGTVEIRYNSFGQLAFEKSIEGFETTYGYNSDGFLEDKVDGTLTTGYAYSGDDGARGLPTKITPPEGAAYDLDYNERGELITVTRGAFFEKRSSDINGHLVRRETSVSGGVALVETSSYLQNGFMTERKWLGVETDGGSPDLKLTFTPDNVFRVKEITYPGLRVRKYLNYDHLGRPLRMEFDNYAEDYTFDLNGNLRTVTRAGATDEFIYDGYDRLVTTKAAAGTAVEETTREYYGNDELKKLIVKDAAGNVNLEHAFTVDSSGRTLDLTVTGDSGAATTSYVYDQASRKLTINGPADHITVTYDAAGQMVSKEDSTRKLLLDYQGGTEVKSSTSTESGRPFQRNFQPYNLLNQSEHVGDGVGTIADLVPRVDGKIERVTDGLGHKTQFTFSKFGEVLSRVRDNQVEFQHTYAPNRAESHAGDKTGAGHSSTFDNAFRLQTITLRKPGNTFTTTGFDLRNNLALTVQMPGGNISYGRDTKGRMTSRSVSFGSGTRDETWGYDGLDRITSATFPQGSASLTYDKLGPLRTSSITIRGNTYGISTTIRNDEARLTLSYPSPAVTVTEGRDPAGRLTTVLPSSGDPVLQQSTYGAADFMSQETLGPGLIQCVNTYDDRKRLTARAYNLAGGGKMLADVRYAYDLADNLTARQYLHRAGRADLFAYDDGNRLTRVEAGVRPITGEAAARAYSGFTVPPNVPGSWAPGFFSRAYGYSSDGLDTFTGMTETNPDGVPGPVVAQSYSGTDPFLNIQSVDGVSRSSDDLGNTIQTRLIVRNAGSPLPAAVNATLEYNGLSQLTKITRADGVSIRYEYQHDGLLCYRIIDDPSLPGGKAETAFVWHQGLLLAEYDRTSGNRLQARYYYGLSDVPIAADIADGSGSPRRFYLLQEANGSVMALVDENGQIAERYFYDAWGQPEIEGPDSVAPHIRRIVSEGTNVLVEFSERILPPIQGAGSAGLASQLASLANAFILTTNGTPVPGTTQLAEQVVGFGFSTVLRFKPQQPISGPCSFSLSAGAVVDEANNTNASQVVNFTFNPTPGAVLFTTNDLSSTAPPIRVRSAIGSSLLFHGQLFDYDAGLSYMRARFYDPYTGLFLQTDPDGYEDSPNLYAAFGNNPTSYRDPTGKLRISSVRGTLGRYLIRAGKTLSRMSPKSLRPIAKFIRRTGEFLTEGTKARTRMVQKLNSRASRSARSLEESLKMPPLDKAALPGVREIGRQQFPRLGEEFEAAGGKGDLIIAGEVKIDVRNCLQTARGDAPDLDIGEYVGPSRGYASEPETMDATVRWFNEQLGPDSPKWEIDPTQDWSLDPNFDKAVVYGVRGKNDSVHVSHGIAQEPSGLWLSRNGAYKEAFRVRSPLDIENPVDKILWTLRRLRK